MLLATWVSTLLLASAAFADPEGQVRRTAGRLDKQSPFNAFKPRVSATLLPTYRTLNTARTGLEPFWNTLQYAVSVFVCYATTIHLVNQGTFYEVTGTFTVQTPSAPDGYASAWVGIDGDTCQTAILQTGVDFNLVNGVVSYDAWYEWFPDYAYYFNGITINSGNVIKLTVTASSTTTGTAVIQNLSNGQTVTQSLSYPQYPLCEQNAEWIVEDFSSGGGLVPFCDFGTVTFTNAVAYMNGGGSITPNGATEIDIQQGSVLTSVSESASGVTIKYV